MSSAELPVAMTGQELDAVSLPAPLPFDLQWVILTKREHIELRMQAKQWKSLHDRAVRRLEFVDRRHRFGRFCRNKDGRLRKGRPSLDYSMARL